MKKTKKLICISLDRVLFDIIEEKITNRSKYIEWLIYQDLKKKGIKEVEDIIV